MGARVRRGLLWGALAALFLGSLVYAFAPRPIPVEIVQASEGPLVLTVDEEGTTRVRDIYVLSSPVAGRILRVEGEAGDAVTQNETIVAQIEPADPTLLDPRSEAQAEAAVRAAESARDLAAAETRRGEAELDFANAELDRARALFRDKTISQRELEAARRAYEAAVAALESARAALQVQAFELESARSQLLSPAETLHRSHGDRVIPLRSPLTGRILRVVNESERVVAAGEPLMEIGDPSDLELVVDLLSADAVKVSPGQRVIVEAWGGEVPLEGEVRRVEPFGFTKVSALGIEEQRVNVVIDLLTDREVWQRLGHGYQVDVRIVLWEGASVLRVPLTALFREGGDWCLFVARDGRAERRCVQVGVRNGVDAQILAGIESGEHVLAHPSDRVTDGTRIRPRLG